MRGKSLRGMSRAATVTALVAAGLAVSACQTPTYMPTLSAAAPALGDTDFRADGVSRREIVVRMESGSVALPKSLKTKWRLPSLRAAVVEVPIGQSPEQAVSSLLRTAGVRYADVVRQVEVGDPEVEDRTAGYSTKATWTTGIAPRFTTEAGTSPGNLIGTSPGTPGAGSGASAGTGAGTGTARGTVPGQNPPMSADPRMGEQYGLDLVKAQQAWAVTSGDKRTLLAIVDSGIDITHPDLRSQIAGSYNVLTKGPDISDRKGHGTHTSGIAAAAAGNGEGGAGVAPGCGLLAVQISSQGLGKSGRSSDVLASEGVMWAVDKGARVISMSFGFYRRSRIFEEALQYALDHDVVLVASGGNNHTRNDPEKAPHLPSTYPGVIEVAAVDRDARPAEFSNFGRTVTVAAPGVDILSSIPGGYKTKSGTSMAAPHVAGVAALVRSYFPELDRAGVKARLEQTAVDLGDPGVDEIFGSGLVDAAAAVRDLPMKPALR